MRIYIKCRFPIFSQILLLICIAVCYTWDVSSPRDASKQCAELFFQGSFQGSSIQLRDDEQVSDLSDARYHFGSTSQVVDGDEVNKQEANEAKAEATTRPNAVSFRVQEGCNLKLSPNPYLRDQVDDFTQDTDTLDSFTPNSAACQCPKACKCEDNRLRRSECARAFLSDDCTNCKALFTSMTPSEGWKQFPQMWSSIVKSIILRDGCMLSLKHSHTGNRAHTLSSRSPRIIKDARQIRNITQYHCRCSETRSPKSEPNTENYPPLINIPKNKGGINTLLFSERLKNHPGLIAALQSLRNKRSSKNAYILLLGMTGSGKSSAVNLLFDHPNITKTGDFVSTTSDILQFSIPVPVPELGMNNTALHVIDTPGIGDTRGIAEDARYLASLEDFISKHEDLRRNLPNVVLIFSKFSDNRYRGEGASFVKMLRTIDLFKDKIIDKQSTNVIFVLTHYMSETKDITRDPSERIRSIRQVIQEYSTLPRPIHIVLAENKPEESHLPSINGFYQLPNGDFYPKNLFDQMQRNLNGDPVGEAIIRSAFSNSENFQISGKRYRLLHQSNAKVTKYLGVLASFNTPVSGTEVSTELNRYYEELDPQLKSSYPDALNTLQHTLYMQNIFQISDLPQSVTDTLTLLENIHVNPVTLFLLENAFNITIPEFKGDYVVGSGYSLIYDTTLPSKIFTIEVATEQLSDLLFRIPDTYRVELQNQLDSQVHVFTSRDDFIHGRIKSFGLNENTMPVEAYKASPTAHPGFNLISLSEIEEDATVPEIAWNSLTATVDYHTFHIGLAVGAKFTDEFSSLLGQLERLNLTDPVNVENWRQFFSRYGTHVVTQAFGGGSIQVKAELVNDEDASSAKTNNEKFAILSEAMGKIMQGLANELIGKDAGNLELQGIKYEFHQRGGNHKYYWSNFSDLDDTKNIDEWKTSLKYEPVVLTSRLQLVPISEVVKEIEGNQDYSTSTLIEEAATNLYNASLVYIPIHRMGHEDNLESRDRLNSEVGHLPTGDFESLQEFSNMFKAISDTNKQMQEQLVRLMAESQEKQQRQEEQWQREFLLLQQKQAEEEQARRDDARYDKEMQLKREELELQRVTQENALRLQMEQSRHQLELQQRLMMQEMRSKNEQALLGFINAENDRRAQIAMNQKGWLDKTFDFFGQGMESMKQMAGPALMALGMGR